MASVNKNSNNGRRKVTAPNQRKRKRTKAQSSDSETSLDDTCQDEVDRSQDDDHNSNNLTTLPQNLEKEAAASTQIPQSLQIWDTLGKPKFVGITPCFGFDPPPSIKPEPIDPTLGFSSMGGCDHLLEYVRTRILFPIKNREFMERHGRVPPKGVILHGPPGTGKTMFAKVLAAELSMLDGETYTFFMRRGTDVLSKWVGESEKTVRQVFAQAIKSKPSILFFDEIDGLCPNRNGISSNSCPVFANVVCTVLGEMDKIQNGEVLVLGATNRLDACDPALLRPGRCDISIPFHPPNAAGRKQIIQVYTKNWGQSSPSPDVLDTLVQSTNGFTGADLNKLCSEAFFSCIRRTQKKTPGCGSTDLSSSIKELDGNEQVTEEDWMTALGSMRPSKSNVFGSYIQVLPVSKFIQPLIKTSSANLLAQLTPFVPKTPKLLKGPTGGPNCFLAWNSCEKSDDILDLLIMPTVLEALSGLTLFVLNEESMLQQHNGFTINAIINIVNQAKDCDQASILFIPRIDKMARRLGGETILLKKLLFDTGNKSVIVVATASSHVDQLCPDLQSIFDGHDRLYQLEPPTRAEREAFFQPIFLNYAVEVEAEVEQKRKSSTTVGKGCRTSLDKLFVETVNITDHDDMWSMITLHRELVQLCQKHVASKDKKGLISDMGLVVQEYKVNRLEAGKKK